MDGLKLFSGLTTADYYSKTGLSVYNVKEEVLGEMEGKKYHKVYVELGINEITFEEDYFKRLYGEMIDAIREIQPDTDVYIMSLNKENIQKYNKILRKLAGEKGCYYLDVYSALVNKEGNLPSDMSWDGIHLTAEGYGLWENYIRTHYE